MEKIIFHSTRKINLCEIKSVLDVNSRLDGNSDSILIIIITLLYAIIYNIR